MQSMNQKVSAVPFYAYDVWTDEDEAFLSSKEITSLNALTAYIVHIADIKEEIIHKVIAAKCGVEHISKLQLRHYEKAIRSLLNLTNIMPTINQSA